jgi:hypothetical protein
MFENCKCSSGPRNVLTIMPVVNRILSLPQANNVLNINKIFKNNTIL